MSTQEILLITAIFSGFLVLRIGVPLGIMWLLRLFFGRMSPTQLITIASASTMNEHLSSQW